MGFNLGSVAGGLVNMTGATAKGSLDAVKSGGSSIGDSLGGFADFVPGIGDARAQDKANAQNILLDKMNRDWQEKMSNSAYQRAMADMSKAGLNPILAYQQGGASVPSTSAPSVGASSKTALAGAALSAYTGISATRTAQQQANTAQASADSSINLQAAQTAKEIAQTQNTQADTAMKHRELKGRRASETIDKAAGGVIQKIIDNISNSAKKSKHDNEPLIKVLGPGPKNFKMKKD